MNEQKIKVTTITPTPAIWKRLFLVIIGAFIMAVNLNTFVYTGSLYPGGLSGVSLLIQRAMQKFFGLSLPYSALYLTLNAFPVYISFKFIGKKFTLFSLLMIALSSILADILPNYKLTEDVLLCAIFGGIFNGFAIVLCLYADATSGGTDFIAIYFAERRGKDTWNYIFVGNCCVLAISGFLFGWDGALYSIFFQFTSTQILGLLYHRYQKATMLIITEHPDELYQIISQESQHDATKIKVVGCYKNTEKTLLYTVVSGDQVKRLSSDIRKTDPAVFINVLQTKDVLGKFFTRRND